MKIPAKNTTMRREQRMCEALVEHYPLAPKDVRCGRRATWSGMAYMGRMYYCGWHKRARVKIVSDWRRES